MPARSAKSRKWIAGALHAGRAAAVLTVAIGVNGTLSAIWPQYEPIYGYLAAAAVIIAMTAPAVLPMMRRPALAVPVPPPLLPPVARPAPVELFVDENRGEVEPIRLDHADADLANELSAKLAAARTELEEQRQQAADTKNAARTRESELAGQIERLQERIADQGNRSVAARRDYDALILRVNESETRVAALQQGLDAAQRRANDEQARATREATLREELQASARQSVEKATTELRRDVKNAEARTKDAQENIDLLNQRVAALQKALEASQKRANDEHSRAEREAAAREQLETSGHGSLQKAISDLSTKYEAALLEAKQKLEIATKKLDTAQKELKEERVRADRETMLRAQTESSGAERLQQTLIDLSAKHDASVGEAKKRADAAVTKINALQLELDRTLASLSQEHARADREAKLRAQLEAAARETLHRTADVSASHQREAVAAREAERVALERVQANADRARSAEERAKTAEEKLAPLTEQIRLSNERHAAAEENSRKLEERARLAEEVSKSAEEKVRSAEERARLAIERAAANTDLASKLEERARLAEERVKSSEEKVRATEERARIAIERASNTNEVTSKLEERARTAEERAKANEGKIRSAEERARAAIERAGVHEDRTRKLEEAARAAEERRSAIESEMATVRAEMAALIALNAERSHAAGTHEQRVAQLTEALDQQKRAAEEQLRAAEAAVQEQLRTAEESQVALQYEMLSAKRAAETAMQEQMRAAEESRIALQNELQAAKRAFDDERMRGALDVASQAKYAADIQDAKQQLESARTEIESLNRSLALEREGRRNDTNQFDQRLRSIVDGINSDYENSMGEAMLEKEGLKAELRSLTKKFDDVQAFKTAFDSLRTQADLARIRATDLEAEREELMRQIHEVKGSYESNIAQALVEKEGAKADLRTLHQKVQELQRKLEEERRRMDAEWNEKLQKIVTHLAEDHEADLGEAMLQKEAARAEARNFAAKATALQERLEAEREKFRLAVDRWQKEQERAAGRRTVPPTVEQPLPPLAAVQSSKGKPVVILIVHSDAGIRAMSKHSLQQAGYTVLTAADGLEGLRTATQQKPDVVLAESVMPKMNARELVQLLKSKRETADVKIILLSGNSPGADRGADFRADDIVHNAADFNDLQAALTKVLLPREDLRAPF